jgi:multiple sugar transport system permease protein
VAADTVAAVALLAPALVLLAIFVVVPFVLAIGLSLTNQRLISPLPLRFVGLDNYARVLADPVFWRAAQNTLVFAAVVPIVQSTFALLLAVLVNQRLRGVTVFRAIYFAPVVVAIAVVSTTWRLLFNSEGGMVNAFLGLVTAGAIQPRWLDDAATALPAIMITSIWQGVGFQMVILLAGLQAIPAELYEAAEVDGASPWQRFRHITLPGLRNSIIFVLIVSLILSFRLFDQVFVMTKGGPLDSTVTLIYRMVQVGFEQQRIAQGSAIAVIYFAFVLGLTIIARRVARPEST